MPLVLGIDLGTTTVTALALDTDTGAVHTCTRDNAPALEALPGYSEWEPASLVGGALECLEDLSDALAQQPVGLGITGQQHGVVLVSRAGLEPRTPFIGWQDRRGQETFPGTDHTFVEEAARAAASPPATWG
jgi:sugar (pentulose or hexulose) kinase